MCVVFWVARSRQTDTESQIDCGGSPSPKHCNAWVRLSMKRTMHDTHTEPIASHTNTHETKTKNANGMNNALGYVVRTSRQFIAKCVRHCVVHLHTEFGVVVAYLAPI